MITVESLTRRYAGFTAVDDVSFTAQPGRVTGFLGPNGAGKSTTMRVMVGLTVPTSGSATIDGVRFADLPNPGLEVGVLLDASAQHAGRTGREILTTASDTVGLPRTRVEEMLELVQPDTHRGQAPGAQLLPRDASTPRDRHRAARRPEGADPRRARQRTRPAGIRWMRDLLTGFASQGGTVLLSSHLLHEIEVIADDLVVIGNGKIVASGTKAELLAAAGTLARSTSPRDLAHALEQAGIPSTLAGDGSVRTDADPARVGAVALTAGIALTELRSAEGAGLEDMFLSLDCRDPTRRSCGMTATIIPPATTTEAAPVRRTVRPIPTTRLVTVELRKMFTTRSGFWMLISIGVLSVIATGSVIIFAPDSAVTYEGFTRAIGFPMSVILPMIAILAVTSEWSQRSGLTTFTLVPSRGRVIGAKAIATLLVGLGSMAVAFAVGALGNLAGSALAGVDTIWDVSLSTAPQIVLGDLVGMAIGFTLGVVLRNSAAAIVGYFVVSFVLSGILELLAWCGNGSRTYSRGSTGTTRRWNSSRAPRTPLRSGRCSPRPR